jgi:hypothetical protein
LWNLIKSVSWQQCCARVSVKASAEGAPLMPASALFSPRERNGLMAVIDSTEESIRVRQ